MQQKLDELCARLEKIENLMVSAPKRKMQESKEPWYPPEEKFGPWVETYGNPITDVPQDQRVQLLTRWQRINKCGPMHIMLRRTVREDHEKGLRLFPDFVAYRIVL